MPPLEPPAVPPPAPPEPPRRAHKGLGAWLRDVVCGFAAYTGARLIWGPTEGTFPNLPRELLTFAVLWIVFQLLIRGWRYARKGKH